MTASISPPQKNWTPDDRIPPPNQRHTPAEVLAALQNALGPACLAARMAPASADPAVASDRHLWLDLTPDGLRPAVQTLLSIHFPHFIVIAAEDCGATIRLPYFFRIYHGPRHAEILITLTVCLPKDNPVVPSICDLIPAALISEREKQEMMGVIVQNIPDTRRMFLPDDFPEGVYPWRKDETAPKPPLVRTLWDTNRPVVPPPPPPAAEPPAP